MSKIMRISGNFEQFGQWSEPDPSFSGHILVEQDGSFIGYQNELHDAVSGPESLCNDSNNTGFITGYIANNKNGAEGIAYYKLFQENIQPPLMYTIPNLEEHGNWSTPGFSGGISLQGEAKISLEDVVDEDNAIVDKIYELHDLIQNSGDTTNERLLGLTHICLFMLQHLE